MQKVISIDGEPLKKVAEALSDFPNEIAPAIASAVNKTMTSAVTQIKKEVTKEYTIKQKDVTKAIKTTRANVKNLTAVSIAEGGQVALYKFKHTPMKPPPKQIYKQPVRVQVKKGGGRKLAAHNGNKGFVQSVNGANMIFARETKERLPIKKLFALSVPQMISDKNDSKGSITRIKTKANEMLAKKVDQEINYRVNKVIKKSKGG